MEIENDIEVEVEAALTTGVRATDICLVDNGSDMCKTDMAT